LNHLVYLVVLAHAQVFVLPEGGCPSVVLWLHYWWTVTRTVL